jgi:hypothetical protein
VTRVQTSQHIINRSPAVFLNRRGLQTEEDGRQFVLELVAQQSLGLPNQPGPGLANCEDFTWMHLLAM